MIDMEEITGRIAGHLEHLKKYTATPGKGCTRLPFTKEARAAADYLMHLMEEVGLKVHEDEAGNVIGILEGTDISASCVMMGSHYDSVINGGDYDGIAGIVCAIESSRLLREQRIPRRRNLAIAAFCDEEGLRFGTGYFGSGAILGKRDVAYCRKYKDQNGISIYEAMKEYGLEPERIGTAKWPDGSIGEFLELHIEQGPVLASEEMEIGLVDCIVGIRRYAVKVYGRADHAGTTPMDMRMDAVDASAKVISMVSGWAREKADGTVATIGYIHTEPGGVNIVAEKVEFTIDIRSRDQDSIRDISDRVRAALDCEVKTMGGSYEMDIKLDISPVQLSEDMIEIMEDCCRARGYRYKRLSSGAGHDTLEMGQVIPSAMIFVPSKDGRSHCPAEFTKYSDLARACIIMTELAKTLLSNKEIV